MSRVRLLMEELDVAIDAIGTLGERIQQLEASIRTAATHLLIDDRPPAEVAWSLLTESGLVRRATDE